MRRYLILGAVFILCVASLAMAKGQKGVMTGTWDCQAHGGNQGETSFTLFLQQDKEIVDGSFSSPIGGTQISSGAFKRNLLEIHIDTPQGSYTLMAKFSKGALSGSWTSDTEKGIWEGKKQGGGSK